MFKHQLPLTPALPHRHAQPPQPAVDDPQNKLAFSLLWADPADTEQEEALDKVTGFGDSARGGGTVIFGTKAVNDFLEHNSLGYIMRAHEATASPHSPSLHRAPNMFDKRRTRGRGGTILCVCCSPRTFACWQVFVAHR